MHIVPVIDISHGVVVRAVAGERANYRPLETPLAVGSGPIAVARGLRAVFPFDTLYVADLDSIEGRGRNGGLVARLGDALPGVNLWIDNGTAAAAGARVLLAWPNTSVVIGSEVLVRGGGYHDAGAWDSPLPNLPRRGGGTASSKPLPATSPKEDEGPLAWRNAVPPPLRGRLLGGGESPAPDREPPLVARMTSQARPNSSPRLENSRLVLSLDFRGDTFLGPSGLLADADLWPSRLIVMTLARVGTGSGPDLARLAGIASRAGARRVYAAGGIRDYDDLVAVRQTGASGALVSTALHAGTLKAGDLERAAGLR